MMRAWDRCVARVAIVCRCAVWGAFLLLVVDAVATAPARDEAGRVPFGDDTRIINVEHTTVYKTTGAARRLDFVVVLPAKVKDVWDTLTTVRGLRSFYVPDAKIELWPGGVYELYHRPEAPPGERGMEGTHVLSLVPGEMLSGTGSAPPEFPTVREKKTRWIMLLDDMDGQRTRFQLSMPVWPGGEEWDRMFEYLAEHNPRFTEALYKRFADGPVDWSARGVKVSTGDSSSPAADRKLWRVDKSILTKTSIDKIWEWFTTEDGLEKWAAPKANVELEFDGAYELFDNPTAPVGRRGQEGTKILSYLPKRMISHTWLAPPQYPEVREGPAWVVWRFEPQGRGYVRIRYTALGLGNGKQWQDAFNELDMRMDFVMPNLQGRLSQ